MQAVRQVRYANKMMLPHALARCTGTDTGRGGKSLYASQQLGVADTNLFELGHHQDGKTRGLWCAFVDKGDHILCVIDSEGLADALKADRVSCASGPLAMAVPMVLCASGMNVPVPVSHCQ